MTNNLTMTDVAYNFLAKRKKEVEFARLFQEVVKVAKIPEDKISRKRNQLYSELMLDNRFASIKGNKWDLRSRRKFDEVHVDTSNIEIDDEVSDEIEDDGGLDIPDGDEAY